MNSNDPNHVVPYDINIEKAVLGAMLIDKEAMGPAMIQLQSVSCFYFPSHQKIFNAISEMYAESGSVIDILTVSSLLQSQGHLDSIGGDIYLLELQNSIPSTANIISWCKILNNLGNLRQVISTCSSAIEKCKNAEVDSVPEIISEIEQSIFKIREDKEDEKSLSASAYVSSAIKYFEKLCRKEPAATGVSTGLPSLDNLIVCFKKQEMIVLAARPSIGKTSLALNMASYASVCKGLKTAFFSLEMSTEQLTRRLICSLADVSERDFYDKRFDESEFGQKWSKITRAANDIKRSNFYIDPTPGLSINELRAKAIRMKHNYEIEIIFIDYLQLMRADVSRNDNRQVEVSKISVGVKALTKELDVPIVVLAQLNRLAEQGDRPRLSHLRESGAIEQDADIVMFLHRDRDPQKDITQVSVEAEVIVEKNRNGQTGIAKLLFFPKTMRFESKSRYQGI